MALKSISVSQQLATGPEPVSVKFKPYLRNSTIFRTPSIQRKSSQPLQHIHNVGDYRRPSNIMHIHSTTAPQIEERPPSSSGASSMVQRKSSLPYQSQMHQQQQHVRFTPNDGKADGIKGLRSQTLRRTTCTNGRTLEEESSGVSDKRVQSHLRHPILRAKEATAAPAPKIASRASSSSINSSDSSGHRRHRQTIGGGSAKKGTKRMLQLYQESVMSVRKELNLLHKKVDRQLHTLALGQIPKEHRKRSTKTKAKSSTA